MDGEGMQARIGVILSVPSLVSKRLRPDTCTHALLRANLVQVWLELEPPADAGFMISSPANVPKASSFGLYLGNLNAGRLTSQNQHMFDEFLTKLTLLWVDLPRRSAPKTI
ncbi:MAG: hypothetical protein JO007_16485 [Alphaproteobacteria bacterium]|nr:hypothetical protein [Alphaproteobacteria bacterium]